MRLNSLTEEILRLAPKIRGRLTANEPLAPLTWFRVGGPAQSFFTPADEDDLAYILSRLPVAIPVTVIGLGSNVIIRDGGISGLVIRLGGRAFSDAIAEPDCVIRAGAALPDKILANKAAELGIAGCEFLRGVPGAVGGALRMNAGAHGGEIKDIFVSARGVKRDGSILTLNAYDMGFSYRHSRAPNDVIFTQSQFRGRPGDPAAIQAEMERVFLAREAAQPVREKTGGSTFKNPPGIKAWELIDRAGCRGLVVGDAQVSPKHCNFLINRGSASAADIENLGEQVRRRVFEACGVDLAWEIKRLGSQRPEGLAIF